MMDHRTKSFGIPMPPLIQTYSPRRASIISKSSINSPMNSTTTSISNTPQRTYVHDPVLNKSMNKQYDGASKTDDDSVIDDYEDDENNTVEEVVIDHRTKKKLVVFSLDRKTNEITVSYRDIEKPKCGRNAKLQGTHMRLRENPPKRRKWDEPEGFDAIYKRVKFDCDTLRSKLIVLQNKHEKEKEAIKSLQQKMMLLEKSKPIADASLRVKLMGIRKKDTIGPEMFKEKFGIMKKNELPRSKPHEKMMKNKSSMAVENEKVMLLKNREPATIIKIVNKTIPTNTNEPIVITKCIGNKVTSKKKNGLTTPKVAQKNIENHSKSAIVVPNNKPNEEKLINDKTDINNQEATVTKELQLNRDNNNQEAHTQDNNHLIKSIDLQYDQFLLMTNAENIGQDYLLGIDEATVTVQTSNEEGSNDLNESIADAQYLVDKYGM